VATQVERNIGKVRLGYIKRVATQVERNIGKVRLYKESGYPSGEEHMEG